MKWESINVLFYVYEMIDGYFDEVSEKNHFEQRLDFE